MTKKLKRFKEIFTDKVQMLSLIFYILALFILDVNANNIGAYGIDTYVNFINGIKFPATSMFWFGFLAACFFFLLTTVRSLYHSKRYPTKFDLFFSILGIAGLMIILSGGMLIFWHNNALIIPFFSLQITRITYYHIGIGLSIVSLLYFALTK